MTAGGQEEEPPLRGSRTSLTGQEGRRVTRAEGGNVPGSALLIPGGRKPRVPALPHGHIYNEGMLGRGRTQESTGTAAS